MVRDDGNNEWRFGMLVHAVSWLAADPDAALAGNERILVPDEIALDLYDVLEWARYWDFASEDVTSRLAEMNATFDEMSGEENAERWTNEAFASSDEWRLQRERARALLAVMGLPRNDSLAGLPGSSYVFGSETQ